MRTLVILLALVVCSFGLLAAQRTSLLALHGATGGPFWFTKWNLAAPDPCVSWFGVSCNIPGDSVVGLALPSNNLTGTLPDLLLPNLLNL